MFVLRLWSTCLPSYGLCAAAMENVLLRPPFLFAPSNAFSLPLRHSLASSEAVVGLSRAQQAKGSFRRFVMKSRLSLNCTVEYLQRRDKFMLVISDFGQSREMGRS
eukprot:TRINITY_DN92943_c0_g1_i1.p1 TRINITY_DN92943_c0_g1~~TRINITY_DN92943_c0_g1_i1.p1  ORF type:complete len:106 (-),score=4.27 TRINITY_DN92943_c0_g1_i1:2-319(-)